MDEAQRITAGRARILNAARPKWVMVGLDWDGPGVLLLASDRLTRAELDFEARRYEFRDMADMAANFAPSLALKVSIDTRPTPVLKDGYVLIAAPDWPAAIEALFSEWTPDPGQRAIDAAGSRNDEAPLRSELQGMQRQDRDMPGRQLPQPLARRHPQASTS